MRLRHLFPLILIALPALAQDAPPPPPPTHGSYRIAGTVVSISDNHPLQRATVDLLTADNARTLLQTTTSDEYGRFAFTGVPSGNHILRGETRNYLSTEYDQHAGFTTAIVTGAGVDTESLVLKLIPQAVIAGTVRDEVGDPVATALIRLFRQNPASGDDRIQPADGVSTDDLGHFEITRLQPGNYFLTLTARPWYATYPRPTAPPQFAANGATGVVRQPANPQPFGIADSIDPALQVTYPPYFYPGTSDPNAAEPIPLHGGDSLNLSLNLSPVPGVTLSLSLPAQKGAPRIFPQLMVNFRGQSLPVDADQMEVSDQGMLAILPPGDYTLYTSPAPQGYTPYNATGPTVSSHFGTSIHVDSSATVAEPAASTAAHVHVTVHSADNTPLPAHLQLALIRRNSADRASAPVSTTGEVTLEAPPGDYFLQATAAATATAQPLSIRQIISGDKPVPGNQLHLTANQTATLSVLISPANHVLKGFARRDGKPAPGAFILIFPADQASAITTSVRDQSNLDGSFELPGLAPGTYTLLAIDGGWDLNWRDPAVLAHYLPAALTIHIAESEKTQQLRVPLPAQPR